MAVEFFQDSEGVIRDSDGNVVDIQEVIDSNGVIYTEDGEVDED